MHNNLPFRPLDNSSTTRLKYDLEAQHWQRAYKSNQQQTINTDITSITVILGGIVKILLSIVIVICTFLFKTLKK